MGNQPRKHKRKKEVYKEDIEEWITTTILKKQKTRIQIEVTPSSDNNLKKILLLNDENQPYMTNTLKSVKRKKYTNKKTRNSSIIVFFTRLKKRHTPVKVKKTSKKSLLEKMISTFINENNGQQFEKWLMEKENKQYLVKHRMIIMKDAIDQMAALGEFSEEILEIFWNHGASVTDKDKSEITLVHFAASRGYLTVITYLLSKGADINARDLYGNTPLHVAVNSGHGELLENLILFGSKINLKKLNGDSILHDVMRKNDVKLLEQLIKYKDDLRVNLKNNREFTPLLWGVRYDCVDAVKFLLKEFKKVDIGAKNDKFDNIIHLIAGENGNYRLIKAIQECKGPLPQHFFTDPNRHGRTPLMVAAEKGYLAIVRKLVEKHSVSVQNIQGAKAHGFALKNKHWRITNYLEEKGAKIGAFKVDKTIMRTKRRKKPKENTYGVVSLRKRKTNRL